VRYSELSRVHLQSAQAGSTDAKTEWQRARDYLAKSSAIWEELRQKKILMPADATKPDQVAQDLATCDAALSRQL